jgi:hypothetical protein
MMPAACKGVQHMPQDVPTDPGGLARLATDREAAPSSQGAV